MSSGILTSFLGALQASVSVLLTICYGAIAAQFKLLSESSAKDISKTCVRLCLPALLIHNVGSQLHLETAAKYVPILVFAIVYNALSMALGYACTRIFKMPDWVTPAIAFNNTTSLPLLLVQSLDATGILASLDASSDVVDRAKSYFLVNAMVSNSLTFALGPRLLNGHEEDAPDEGDKSKHQGEADETVTASDDEELGVPVIEATEDVEGGRIRPTHRVTTNGASSNNAAQDGGADEEHVTEETSLLPDPIARKSRKAGREAYARGKRSFDSLPRWTQATLAFLYQFANAPLIGAVVGAVIGLTPALHRAFFASPEHGGIFTAWLTSSIKNVGDLFAALQVLVVGVKLSASAVKAKQGGESGTVPWRAFALVSAVRFVVWPLVSIPLVWGLATRTGVLDRDPILWFAMMLMPTGPPALKLTALADVNGSGEKEKMSIAKFLTLSYIISPLICFSVVGSLKASEAAVKG